MKTKRLLLVLSCLLLLTGTGYAQPANPQGDVVPAQMRLSPEAEQRLEMNVRYRLRAYWDGRRTNFFTLGLLQDADLRAAWNVSDEQFEYIQNPNNLGQMLSNHPEYRVIMADRGGGTGERLNALLMEVWSDAIDEALTPEQRQRVGESQLAMMGNRPIVSPSLFEVLNLTDAQREQMEAIKRELEPEFERHLDDYVRDQIFLQNKLHVEREKQGFVFNEAPETRERLRAISAQVSESPEFRRVSEEMRSRNSAFSTQFQTRMLDVLTDEQWERLQYLVDNPPHLAHRRVLEQPRRESDVWVPGADSWRPGMPIPEEYRQQRNLDRRFPRPANQ